MKKEKIEIEIKLLERIAKYYEFPVTVFFLPLKAFNSKRKRKNEWHKKIQKLVKILENFLEEIK